MNQRFINFIKCLSLAIILTTIGTAYTGAQSKIPDGSYKDTCRDFHVVGGNLTASCENKKGQWIFSKIYIDSCAGDIWNENGNLKCKQKPAPPAPSGSYKNSCKDAYTEGKKLYAQCQRKNGTWKNSSINYKSCNKNISNDNGNLVCGKAGGNNKIPPGSYKDSCRNIYKDGNVLEAECKNNNGKWKHTSIKFKKCKNGLWNDNGKLRCN